MKNKDLCFKELKEFEDGSAELIVEMSEETKRYLINYAVIALIEKGLVEVKLLWSKNETECKD